MGKSNYQRIKNTIYNITKIAAGFGMVGGVATQIGGLVTGNDDLLDIGTAIVLPSATYYWAARTIDKGKEKVSDLEKNLK
jgi:hypothetical protein